MSPFPEAYTYYDGRATKPAAAVVSSFEEVRRSIIAAPFFQTHPSQLAGGSPNAYSDARN